MSVVYLYTRVNYDKEVIKGHILNSGVLKSIISTDKVVIKPNLVQESRIQDGDWEYVITHPVIITSVIELLCDILDSTGKIIVADAPMTGASFSKILSHMPVDEWKNYCLDRKISLEIIDLRDEEWKMASNGIIISRKKLPGDPSGKVIVNMKNDTSEFHNKPKTKQLLYGADYDTKETNAAHNGVDNIYSVSRTVIDADVLINLPKLKTHRKAGITCCLKNLVGINTNKNLLPHHTIGTPKDGGDQFESSSSSVAFESKLTTIAKNVDVRYKWLTPILVPLKKIAIFVWGNNKKTVRSGGWYGNDTLWRMILDLNKVMYYSNGDGTLRDDNYKAKKRYIGIVDGIYGGQGNGPLEPEIMKASLLICGTDPVEIDCVAARIMGFDYRKIPQLIHAFEIKKYPITSSTYKDIICFRDGEEKIALKDFYQYDKPWLAAKGWKGYIEINANNKK